jgi:uncharacterized protein YndB with AHSA1/START domain
VPDLHFNVPVDASPEKTFAAVGTEAGMRGWWTADTVMTPKVGGKAEFGFDKREAVFEMKIDKLEPNKKLRMTCTGGPAEWKGTTLEWTVEPTKDGSLLKFEHRGWREMTDFCASCNTMWGNLFFKLKRFVETGKPNPQWTE